MHPTLASERIDLIDILRGFAIFGILLVNMAFYNSPVYLIVTGLKFLSGTACLTGRQVGKRLFAENGKRRYRCYSSLCNAVPLETNRRKANAKK